MIWTGSVRSSRRSDWHNPDYALLDANDELKVYHCALTNDDGEIHDPKLNKYIKWN